MCLTVLKGGVKSMKSTEKSIETVPDIVPEVSDGYPIPALNPDLRENQLIAMATNLAEKKIRDGTASSAIIVHYLKLGTRKEEIEREILEEQRELIRAKTEDLRSAKRIESLYTEAMDAMKEYRGEKPNEF